MKRITLLTCAVFWSISSFAIELKPIAQAVPLQLKSEQENTFFLLDDQSCWEVKKMKTKRSRYWSEWILNQKPTEWELDESFYCDPSTWTTSSMIEAFEADFSPYSNFPYVLVNKNTNEKVFAKNIPFNKLIPKKSFIEPILNQQNIRMTRINFFGKSLPHVFVSNDKSIWLAHPIQYQWRSFWQYMTMTKIDQPDACFVVNLKEWSVRDELYCYPIARKFSGRKQYNYHIKNALYVIHNTSKNQFLFASKLNMNDLFDQFEELIEEIESNSFQRGLPSKHSAAHLPTDHE